MADKSGVPLTGIEGFPPEVADRLAGLWITTAEELVSAAVQGNGPSGLAQVLDLPVEQVIQLVDLAQSALPFGVSFDPGDVQSFGTGALDEPDDEDTRPTAALSFAPLPSKVDLHDRMPPILNQGQRGTCVSFACTAVREFLLGPDGGHRDLSEQYLYWDCKQHDLIPGAGTFISVGMDRLLADGQCPEQIWPYNPSPVAGNEGQNPPPPNAAAEASPFRITETQKLPARSIQSLRQALADGSPIAFAVPVYTYWFTEPVRRTGDIRLPLPGDHREGGHAMCMVGYEEDPQVPGGGYFLIRNSWGTSWASQSSISPGYARLPFAYMEQLASAAHTAKVAPAPKPPEDPPADNFFTRLLKFLRNLFGGG